ncbi:MAG TPA: hypothetical protein VF681_00745 [Abditibacteriaceae bacterium]|jgi:hypothetical protein
MKKVWPLVILAFFALAGYGWWRAKTPPAVGEDFGRLAPATQQQRRADAQKLQDDVKELARAAKNNERRPFELRISESQLNTLLQDNIRSQNAPVKDLRAGISSEGIALQGQVNYQGIDAVVTMNGDLEVVENKLRYKVSSLQIGGFPAPSSLRKNAEKQVSEQLNKYLLRAPGRIADVKFAAKEVVISGETN